MAEVISRSEGLSGRNTEYLFRLEDALAEMGPRAVDQHVSGLVAIIKGGEEEGGEGKGEGKGRGE